MTTSFSDELYHYGIKGMKWGVRRTPEQLGYHEKSTKAQKKAIDDYNSSMDDKAFRQKYGMSRAKFKRHTKRYVNPYTRALSNTSDQALDSRAMGRKAANKIQGRMAKKGESYWKAKTKVRRQQILTAAGSAWVAERLNRNGINGKTLLQATYNSVRKSAQSRAGRNAYVRIASEMAWDPEAKKWVHV